jgi:toxin FitB
MIILDTNVLSELMRDFPNAKVLAWLDLQPPASIWITTVTLMESRFGLFRMPARKRRDHRLKELELILAEDIERRFAPFDEAAALSTALLLAERPPDRISRRDDRRHCDFHKSDLGHSERRAFQ